MAAATPATAAPAAPASSPTPPQLASALPIDNAGLWLAAAGTAFLSLPAVGGGGFALQLLWTSLDWRPLLLLLYPVLIRLTIAHFAPSEEYLQRQWFVDCG